MENNIKKILVVCTAGMSTSILVNKMKIAAKEINEVVEISSLAIWQGDIIIGDTDLILLGPQVAFKKEEIEEKVNKRIPVEIIATKDYGMMDGMTILINALEKLKNKV